MALVVLALLLSACGDDAAGSGTPGGAVTGDWVLAAGTVGREPLEPVPGRTITLTINDGQATGTSACNSYFGTVAIDGGSVRFDGLGGTEMACEPDVMALEQAYLAALGNVREAAVEGDQLVLTGADVELRFDTVEPFEPAALVGTSWELEAVIGAGGLDASASSPLGEPATLELAHDGTITGSTGCNGFGGTYEVDGDQFTVGELAHTTHACPGDDIAAQARTLQELYAQPLTVSIKGEVLTLSAADGSGLVYRVQQDQAIPDDGITQEPLPLPGRSTAAGWWLLREGTSDGAPIAVGDHRITLGLVDGQLSARAECNSYGAPVAIDQTTISAAATDVGAGSTDMLCEGLMELEASYFSALSLPLAYERSGERLVLRGDHGELMFEPAPEIDVAALVGRTWVLDSLLDPDGTVMPAVGAAELVLADDGTYTGTAGACAYFGEFVIEGDQVTYNATTIDESACPDDVDAVGARVFAAQGSAFVPVIDGDTMTIIGQDGAGIVYIVERPAG